MRIPCILQYSWVALCATLLAASAWAEDAEKKAPVPDEAAQAVPAKLLKEVYGDELAAAKTVSQKKTLAKKLLEKGAGTQNDLASKYVLLKAARSVAMQAMDAETAFEAIDRMAGSFAVDALAMKTGVLDSLTQKARTANEHVALAGLAIGLMDQAQTGEKFQTAEQLGNLALEEARAARSPQLLQQVRLRLANVRQKAAAYDEQRTALATLDKTPDDPQANLVVGRYRCFVKGDWERGIPMLALGKDDDLKAVATTELKGAASETEQMKLGDAWWDLAQKQEGAVKSSMQQRAGYWYQKGLPGLSGLMKDKVEKRLAQAADGLAHATVNVNNYTAAPGTNASRSTTPAPDTSSKKIFIVEYTGGPKGKVHHQFETTGSSIEDVIATIHKNDRYAKNILAWIPTVYHSPKGFTIERDVWLYWNA